MEKRTLYKEGTYKKGNLHTHTTWSDGMHTPAETAEHYRSKGYDFLALTDHWVYGIHPELNRDDFLLFPGTELDIELPGRKDHHLVGFGLPETNRIPEHYTFEEERKNGVLTTAERIIEYFGQRGNVTLYGHPYWSKIDSTDIKYLQGMIGMEIYNHGMLLRVMRFRMPMPRWRPHRHLRSLRKKRRTFRRKMELSMRNRKNWVRSILPITAVLNFTASAGPVPTPTSI